MNDNVLIQKLIPKARRRFTAEQIQEHLKAQANSGASVMRDCSEHQLSCSLFYSWRRRWGSLPAEKSLIRFEAIPVKNLLASPWAAEVSLSSGIQVRFRQEADPNWAGILVTRLTRPC